VTFTTDIISGFDNGMQKLENFHPSFFGIQIGINEKTHKVFQTEAIIIGVFGIILTGIYGFEVTVMNIFFGYPVMGAGIHLTTISTMAFTYVYVSWQLQKFQIIKIRNILYSFIISWGLANGLFEILWCLAYETFHFNMQYLITLPFLYDRPLETYWAVFRNVGWIILGLIFVKVFKTSGKFKVKDDLKMLGIFKSEEWKATLVTFIMVFAWLFWIYYPLPFQVVYGSRFPQTLYFKQIGLDVYVPLLVPNLGVHLTNVLVKAIHFFGIAYLFTPSAKLTNLIRKVDST